MRKAGMLLGAALAALVALVALVAFVGPNMNRWLHPPLPVPNVSAKEAVKKLQASGGVLAELGAESDAKWYIARFDGGIAAVDEAVKRMHEAEGWTFTDQDGAGLFFQKDGERRVATTRIWNRRYVLVKARNLR